MNLQQSSSGLARILLLLAAVGLVAPAALASQKADAQEPAAQDKPAPKQERGVGQQITDGWITMKIHAQFVTEDALDGSDIDVDTTSGVVSLTGTVPTAAARARAMAVAKATDGVKSVSDKLRIVKDDDRPAAGAKEAGRDAAGAVKQGGRRVNDGWIKSKIYAQFLTEDALENSDVDITVKNGVVTLSGTVASAAGQTRAAAIAKGTDGVKDVKNALKVAKK